MTMIDTTRRQSSLRATTSHRLPLLRSGSLQRAHAGRVPARPARVLPVGSRLAAQCAGGHVSTHRDVPKLDGGVSLAASTIDRRLSTVCGLYRFAHIDGARRRSNRTQQATHRFADLVRGVS